MDVKQDLDPTDKSEEEVEAGERKEEEEEEEEEESSEEDVVKLRRKLRLLETRLDAHKGHKVIVRREKPLKTFTGESSVQEWIDDCKSALEERKGAEAVSFIKHHLGGQAKKEVKLNQISKPTPESIFKILIEQFGQKGSFNEAVQAFYARRQKEGEDMRDYSYDLIELMTKIEQWKPGSVPNKDEVLRDQLIAGIRDATLRRELKQRVIDKPDYYVLKLNDYPCVCYC